MTPRSRAVENLFADPFSSSPLDVPELTPRGGRKMPGELGVWVLIIGDMLFFGLLFIVFVHERSQQIAVFETAHATMSLAYGMVNTLLLLTGSACVTLGVSAFRDDHARWSGRMFLLAKLCGLAFIVNKYFEWSDKLAAGNGPFANNFYMFYFVLTSVHLIHLLVGLVALAIMYRITRKSVPGAADLRHVESGACFWHLIDLLWIVLFALLYLVR